MRLFCSSLYNTRGNELKVAVNQTKQFAGAGGAPGNRSSFKTITRKKRNHQKSNCYQTNSSSKYFFISFKKFLEDLNAAGASTSPKDKRLRSPSPYGQQPRAPSWSKAGHFEYKDKLPVAGELN